MYSLIEAESGVLIQNSLAPEGVGVRFNSIAESPMVTGWSSHSSSDVREKIVLLTLSSAEGCGMCTEEQISHC